MITNNVESVKLLMKQDTNLKKNKRGGISSWVFSSIDLQLNFTVVLEPHLNHFQYFDHLIDINSHPLNIG